MTAGMRLELAMHRRRPDAIQPTAAIAPTWRGERGAGELLGVEAMGHLLRRVTPDRQTAGNGLGGELVAKTRHVVHAAHHSIPDYALANPESRFPIPDSRPLQHPAPHLIALDRFEQGLEVAFAETFIALALDDLEEDRPQGVLGEDLQQQALLGFRIGVDQD